MMNGRIKKLVEQAEEYASKRDMTGEYIISFDQNQYTKKFAELLIRECAELATKEYDNRGAIHGQDLMEHFGIE